MSVREIREMKREYTDVRNCNHRLERGDIHDIDADESDIMSKPACDEDGVILDISNC